MVIVLCGVFMGLLYCFNYVFVNRLPYIFLDFKNFLIFEVDKH